MMATVDRVCQVMAEIAPLRLAEEWDNVGLLIGDRRAEVRRVMTCLTITPDVIDEAISSKADIIVAHHPLPFRPMNKLTTDTVPTELVWRLAGAKIAVYSAHTAFDSSATGINQFWAESLGLSSIEPMTPNDDDPKVGSGRVGMVTKPTRFDDLALEAKRIAGVKEVRLVGDVDAQVHKVGVACGSGGSFLAAAKRRGCSVLITGEATFHVCLEARSMNIGLVLVGHYGSERFAMDRLAERLSDELDLECWPSRVECDPLKILGH
jgi:dinuclear metal center YbgI/SA1388 family protein